MEPTKFIVRVGAIAGALAALLLAAMIVVGAGIGSDLNKLQSSSPVWVAELLVEHTGAIQTLMVIDDLFVVAYLAAFIGLSACLRERAGWLALIALGAAATTGTLDFLENSYILGLIAYQLPALPMNTSPLIDATQLLLLNVLTQMKYLAANVAIAFFGVSLWNTRASFDRVVGALFWLFAPINVLAFVNPAFVPARLIAMLALLLVGARWLWTRK